MTTLLSIRNTSSSSSSSRQRIALNSASTTMSVILTVAAASLLLFQPVLGVSTSSSSDGVQSTDDDHQRTLGRFTSSLDLQCPTCDRIHCTPRRASKLKCKGGISRGICNCCPVCAKTEGESCGGQWHYLGKCDAELVCEAERVHHANTVDAADDQGNGGGMMTPVAGTASWAHWRPEGKCRKRLTQSDQPQNVNKCYPRCTAEYCRAHPKAVCSATENAERKQPCQTDCQHTSCGACSYVRPDTECVKCRRDDLACIRKFGRCIRRLHCNRTKQSCRPDKDDARLKFQCLVPSCLSP